MKADRASIRYAKALLELANENQKEKSVLEEMQNILSIMESSPQLDKALNKGSSIDFSYHGFQRFGPVSIWTDENVKNKNVFSHTPIFLQPTFQPSER